MDNDDTPSRTMAWFTALDLDEQVALLADPSMPLPVALVTQLTAGGTGVTTDAFWVEQQGPTGFYLSGTEAARLRDRRDRLNAWWDELTEEARTVFIEHRDGKIPADFRSFGLRIPDGVVTGIEQGSRDLRTLPFSVGPVTRTFLEWKARERA